MPDVSGVDKCFDYIVPASMAGAVAPGCRVRVNLNGRRVSGWVVTVSHTSDLDVSRLVEVVSVSGPSVEPDVVPLTKWIADSFIGPWRAVLASAAAPRVVQRDAHATHGRSIHMPVDEVVRRADELLDANGGLLLVPPCESALSVVCAAARRGPVLVVCPTVRMVRMGAASLRKRGFTTAELPEEWERARAGVDVVMGARAGVLGPCRDLSAIVVIDEHEETFHEERSPTWNASDVAAERARSAGIPVLYTSAVPSASALERCASRTSTPEGPGGWPTIEIEDLTELNVARSLLGSRLLQAVSGEDGTVACVLNSVGVARTLACSACSSIQVCPACGSSLAMTSEGLLVCHRCSRDAGGVCLTCGRTAFKILSGGTALLARQLRRSTTRTVVEVTATTDEWVGGDVFCGTEAVLNRIPRSDVVVFCDIDRDLLAPRLSAPREALSMVARASRLVGSSGRVIIQTRSPHHPVLAALGSARITDALMQWNVADVSMRRTLGLPPFSVVARIHGVEASDIGEWENSECDVAADADGVVVRAPNAESLRRWVDDVRARFPRKIRVHVDPSRF